MLNILATIVTASLAAAAATPPPAMPHKAFAAAINASAAEPTYVLVTVVNDSSGRDWTGCVAVPQLIGAMTIEKDLPRTQEGFNQARDLVLASTDHVFRFRKPAAIRNMPQHTDAQWDDARLRLKNRSKDELLKAPSLNTERNYVVAAATACAIIERGLIARRLDRNGAVVAEESPSVIGLA